MDRESRYNLRSEYIHFILYNNCSESLVLMAKFNLSALFSIPFKNFAFSYVCSILKLQCAHKHIYYLLMQKRNITNLWFCHGVKHVTLGIKRRAYTVETRNFEVAWFDIPVVSISFWSPELFCYIFNVNKIACLDIQSFDIFSHSMSMQGPNTTFHTLRLTHGSKSISRLSFRRGAKCSVCLSTISAQSRLV